MKNKPQVSGSYLHIGSRLIFTKYITSGFFSFLILFVIVFVCWDLVLCDQDIKQPNVAGSFYPENSRELSRMIDNFINSAVVRKEKEDIFALILPHAGYGFSGPTASFGYKLVKTKKYKTVVIIGTSHHYSFIGASVYPKGKFMTPLGPLDVDEEFAAKLLLKDNEVYFEPLAFQKEHSVEVQLPFLQKTLSDFKIVPIITGDCTFALCQHLAGLIKDAIGERKDVLIIASTDMYHGYDYQEAELIDSLTISYLRNMDARGLYEGLRESKFQLCGGFGVVATIILSKELGYNNLEVLNQTNSAMVTQDKTKGTWTVGYVSCLIGSKTSPTLESANPGLSYENIKGEKDMLNHEQKKRLLELARNSIHTYLSTGKRIELKEEDPALLEKMGAFVTLNEAGQLRGCIGNMVGVQPLYLTVRDMAIEAATGDPRFSAIKQSELKNIEIEISVLSPLVKVDSPDKVILGKHGVLVKRGLNSGVFLPQVATETGWTKEEFLSNLCAHKAGINANAWKDKTTDLYIFTAEVFSEKEL